MNIQDSFPRPTPIRVALRGFSNYEEAREISALFAQANRWQRPWQMVAPESDDADFLLMFGDGSELIGLGIGGMTEFGPERLISYSVHPVQAAHWHLPRSPGRRAPSLLEFSLLLKRISQSLPLPELPQPVPQASPAVQDKPNILIVGSVGSGKTTAVSTLAEGKALATEAVPSDHTQLSKRSTTVAMDFACVPLDDGTRAHVYGAPGQRRFDFMSDILIRKAQSLVVLVSNAASNSLAELHYYLDVHREFLSHHPAVVGVTHNDVNPSPSLKEYARAIESRGEAWPVFKIDARKREDLLKLLATLLEAARLKRS